MFTVIIAIYFVVVFILTLPMLGITTLMKKRNIRKAEKLSSIVLKILAKGCLFLSGTRVKVLGMENIPNQPALFVGNHRSYYDIIGFYGIINRPVGFVSKENGTILSSPYCGCIFEKSTVFLSIRAGVPVLNLIISIPSSFKESVR